MFGLGNDARNLRLSRLVLKTSQRTEEAFFWSKYSPKFDPLHPRERWSHESRERDHLNTNA